MAEQKTCKQCQNAFIVTDEDLAFYQKMSPTFAGKTFEISSPTFCPICRARTRLGHRNLRNLTIRKCSATGESIFSHFSENTPFPVYKTEHWWSDAWEGTKFGRDIDFSRPFFEQFAELYNVSPQLSRSEFSNENCDYSNGIANCKNCYLGFNLDYCENCYYLTDGHYNKSCVDSYGLTKCELCYECVRCSDCYGLNYSTRCNNCSESFFLADCRGCKSCIGCCNLSQAEYQIFNKKVSREEFETKKKELENYDNLVRFAKEFRQFQLNYPKKFYFGHSNEEYSGDDIRHLNNSHSCFYSDNLEDCKYCNSIFNAKNCYDYHVFGDQSEWIYNCLCTGEKCSHIAFSIFNWTNSRNCYYSNLLVSCQDCFGCSSLKHKQYCILNKQYTKEEYEALVPKVIEHMQKTGEWGEFFPITISPFAFNETLGQENYPLSKEEIEKRGWKYKEPEDKIPQVEGVIEDPTTLPKTTSEATENVLKWAIKCENSGRPFLIQGRELAFYKQQNIPLPHFHPEIRHQKRLKLCNPFILHHRQCMCEQSGHDHSGRCPVEFETTYAPDRPEKVYCEKCYQQSVV